MDGRWHSVLLLLPLLLLLSAAAAAAQSESVACSVAEEQLGGTFVCDLAKKTREQTIGSGNVSSQYQLVANGDNAKYFELDATSGHLRLASRIDREAFKECRSKPEQACRLTLTVSLLTYFSELTILTVFVTVEDINDNTPTFDDRGVVRRHIKEHDRMARIQLPRATDPDAGKNGSIVYSFPVDRQSHGDYQKFALDEDKENGRNLMLRVISDIDLEGEGEDRVRNQIELVVLASDEGSPPRSSNLTVVITVENVNDFEPVFEPGAKVYLVKENTSVNTLIFTARATDRDETPGAGTKLIYSIRRTEPPAPFSIDRNSGDVRLWASLNAEEKQDYNFEVEVSDSHGVDQKTAVMTVSVKVEDVNDNAPEIRVSPASPSHGLSVLENQASGMIAIIDVTDKDVDQHNRLFDCSLHSKSSQQSDHAFVLQLDSRNDQGAQRFILKNIRPLDRELQSEYRLNLTCNDSSGLHSERIFTVTVRDVNDSPPRFAGTVTRIKFRENQPPNSVMGSVIAHDDDEHSDTRYEMSESCAGQMGIGERNGAVYSKISFDRELNASFHCTVRAFDAKRPEMNAATSLNVEIEDLNDCRPAFRSDNFTFFVPENQRKPLIGQVEATDADSGDNGRLTYSLVQPNGVFRVTSAGEIRMGVGSAVLNREQQSSHSLRVRVQDHGRQPLTAETVVTIVVIDENDNSPRFIYPSNRNSSLNVSVHERPGAIVAKVTAVDDDSGRNGHLTFDLEPLHTTGGCDRELFRLDADSGQLLLAQTVPQAYADRVSCRLKIVASDKGVEPRQTRQSLIIHFTAARPRSMGGSRGAHGADSIGTADGGLGGPPGGRKGPRDLVVITVCVALSFLVLLCVVLLLAYFCYYLQSPSTNPDGARRDGQRVTERRPAGPGTGAKLSGASWLKRLGLTGRSSRACGAPSSCSQLGLGGCPQRGVASTLTVRGATSFISRPVMQMKNATAGYLEDSDQQGDNDDEFASDHHPVQYFGDNRVLSAAGVNQTAPQFPIFQSRRGSAFSRAAATTMLPLYVEHGDEETVGGQFTTGDYQTMAIGAADDRRLHPRRRLNYLSVDSKMPGESAASAVASAGYYKSLRSPSTDPTQRRAAAVAAEVPPSGGDSAVGRPFQTVQYLVDSPVPGSTVMTRLENARGATGGYVYGSPYLTSSFV